MQTAVYRKEIKYVISLEQFARLERQLDAVMQRDRHGENGTYMVRSQYYDSYGDRDLWDNLDGVMEKRKIRVRIYEEDGEYASLEYKCKSGTDGVKYAITISRKEAGLLEQGSFGWLLEREEELAHHLYCKMTQESYHPKTIVEYDRTAFVYPVSDVRITFDHRLRGTANPYGLFGKGQFFAPLLSADKGILEVKYNTFLPSPIKGIVEQTDSLAEASSKYSQARFLI